MFTEADGDSDEQHVVLQDLNAALKKAVSGDLEDLLLELLLLPEQFEAQRLQQAMAVSAVCVWSEVTSQCWDCSYMTCVCVCVCAGFGHR